MKYLSALALIALLAMSAARAQSYDVQTVVDNIAITSSGSSNVAAVVGCTRYDNVTLQIDFKLMGSGTDPVVFNYCASGDGSTYCNAAGGLKGNFSVAANGTTQVTFVTNMTVNAIGYLQISSITGSTNSNVTNLTVKAIFKSRVHG